MTYAREIAHRLHPVQMARCDCDGGKTRAPGGWCAKATGVIQQVIERCAQEAETAYGLAAVNGDAAAEAARRIRALAGAQGTEAGK